MTEVGGRHAGRQTMPQDLFKEVKGFSLWPEDNHEKTKRQFTFEANVVVVVVVCDDDDADDGKGAAHKILRSYGFALGCGRAMGVGHVCSIDTHVRDDSDRLKPIFIPSSALCVPLLGQSKQNLLRTCRLHFQSARWLASRLHTWRSGVIRPWTLGIE